MYKVMGYLSGMLLNIVFFLLFFFINGSFFYVYKIIL